MSTYSRSGQRSPIDRFETLKEQIDHETSVLISERDDLLKSGNRGYAQQRKASRQTSCIDGQKSKDYKNKINGVINLCETDKGQNKNEFHQIIAAEKQILNLLLKGEEEGWGREKIQKNIFEEDLDEYDIDALRMLDKDELIRLLLEAIRLYKMEKRRRIWYENELRRILDIGKSQNPQNYQTTFRSPTHLQQEYQVYTNEYSKSKPLKGQPNQYEINNDFGGRMSFESPKRNQREKLKNSENEQIYYKSQMGRKPKGSNDDYLGLTDLWHQGEKIRKETVRLVKMKEGQGYKHADNNDKDEKIRQLESKLKEQEQGKIGFLDDLKQFKQKYRQLEQENNKLKYGNDGKSEKKPRENVSVLNRYTRATHN